MIISVPTSMEKLVLVLVTSILLAIANLEIFQGTFDLESTL